MFYNVENVVLKGRRVGQTDSFPDNNSNVQLVIPGLGALTDSLSDTFNVSECVGGLTHNLKKDLSLYEAKAAGFRLKLAHDTVPNDKGEKVLNITDPLEFWISQVMYSILHISLKTTYLYLGIVKRLLHFFGRVCPGSVGCAVYQCPQLEVCVLSS